MNKKSLVILIIIIFCILSLYFLWLYNSLNSNESDDTKVNIYNGNTNYLENLDTSEKVAKLYKTVDINKKELEKDISQNEIDKINRMLEENGNILAMISYANSPDFLIEYNNSKETIGFRISNEFIDVVINTSRTYIIYKENDVSELLRILNTNLKDNLQYTELNINEVYSPPKMYVNNRYEMLKGSYIWKDEKGNMLAADVGINFEGILKSKEPVSSFMGPMISLNFQSDGDISKSKLFKLPITAKITYTIHKGNEIILAKEAERMLSGSYHLQQPNVKGDYVYVVTLTFTDIPNVEASYYFGFKL